MTFRRQIHRLLAPLIYRDGTTLVPSSIEGYWPERQFIRRFLERLKVDCVIDVGANEGQYASQLRLIGFKGLIISFEPHPETFAKLAKVSKSDSRWQVFNHALGADAGVEELKVMERSEFNSFREPTTCDTAIFATQNQVTEIIPVQVRRLDTILPELRRAHSFTRPMLKTDTQGFDVEVFRGARGVHADLVGIQCELAIKRLYEQTPLWSEALGEYGSAGFELAGVFPVHPSEPFLIECDCFFQRSAAAQA